MIYSMNELHLYVNAVLAFVASTAGQRKWLCNDTREIWNSSNTLTATCRSNKQHWAEYGYIRISTVAFTASGWKGGVPAIWEASSYRSTGANQLWANGYWRCKEADAVNIFPKLPVYLRTHYSKWQRNQRQRVRDAVAKAAPGETRLRELNAALGFKPAATTKAAMLPVVLPPTMQQQQPPGTLLQPVEGVVVGGTMVGGAPPTRGYGKTTKRQRGKDNVEIVRCRSCKFCTQHGITFEQGKKQDQCARAERVVYH